LSRIKSKSRVEITYNKIAFLVGKMRGLGITAKFGYRITKKAINTRLRVRAKRIVCSTLGLNLKTKKTKAIAIKKMPM
jgi:hypothetical protein